jgi:FMN reductase
MTPRSVVAISAGLSQPSSTRLLTDRLVAATGDALDASHTPANVTTIELRDLAHDITDNLLTGFPSPRLKEVIDLLVAADGVIAVTPIFTASYSGLFKSFFDIIGSDALISTPVLLGATAGTARHSLALEHELRPLFAYLRSVVTPTAVFAASEDWGTGSASTADLSARITRAAGEFATLVAAHAPAADPTDLLANLVPFEQQLASGRS